MPPTTTKVTFKANGSPVQQLYTLARDPGPADTYAVSLLDAHFPTIRYSTLTTVLTPPPASDNGGPLLLPRTFTVHLFAPDSSITVELHSPRLGGNHWDFALPQHSFPPPSQSAVDATYAPPVVEMLRFRWRKEGGILSRSQLRCSLVHNGDEPDTVLAMYAGVGDKAGRGELVVYESNFRRVEMEDLKGLEMVMLVSARAINDIWFLPTAISFNAALGISNGSGTSANTGNASSASNTGIAGNAAATNGRQRGRGMSAPLPLNPHDQHPNSFQPAAAAAAAAAEPKKPAVDLQKQRLQEAEKRRLQEAEKRRVEAERQRAIEDEQAAIRRMLAEEEARERARRQALVDAETEHLRRVYASEAAMPRRASVPQGRRQQQQQQQQQQQYQQHYHHQQQQHHRPPQPQPQPHHPHPRPPPQPPRPQQRPPVVGSGGSGAERWNNPLPAVAGGLRVLDSGKRLDNSSRRKSFLGLSFGGSSSSSSSSSGGGGDGIGAGASASAATKKGKGKLAKKASTMW